MQTQARHGNTNAAGQKNALGNAGNPLPAWRRSARTWFASVHSDRAIYGSPVAFETLGPEMVTSGQYVLHVSPEDSQSPYHVHHVDDDPADPPRYRNGDAEHAWRWMDLKNLGHPVP